MHGIDLNKPITYKLSSLRFFGQGEKHIARLCGDDVLLLVFDGVLRFNEAGESFTVRAGEYHIQHHETEQYGDAPSDMPKYLYIHFLADWTDGPTALPRSGTFDVVKLLPFLEELDTLAHDGAPHVLQAAKFYELLSKLYMNKPTNSMADKIADYIAKEFHNDLTLEMLCEEFHFSKNHIINIFKKTWGITPIVYINTLRLQRAEYLIEVTPDSLEKISIACGFKNYSHFYKMFVRKNGISPEAWRIKMRSSH